MFFRSKSVRMAALGPGICLILSISLGISGQSPRYSSKYKNPTVYDGLYYVVSSNLSNEFEEGALVLSYNDKPIGPKANDPDSPTIHGFYLSYKERFDFERVEVSDRKFNFKTRRASGVSYAFVGISGREIDPNFDSSTPIPFIKGRLTKCRNGKVVKKEKVKFSHAVIA